MEQSLIAAQRLRNQHVTSPLKTPHAVVSSLGAVQAQDYLGALWAVGLRMRDAVEADVERALAEGSIVRTWPLRGTLHFVAAEDVRWILDLLAPRILKRHKLRLERDFDVDAAVLKRSRAAVERALRDGRQLTRPALYAALEKSGVATSRQRGLHITWHLAHEALVCFGPRHGKQQTFVLLDDWVPPTPPKSRDEALGELAHRYFASHGPAEVADFVWWSALPLSEAKRAMEIARVAKPRAARASNAVHLLPPFDELTVAYRDRSAFLDPAHTKRVNAGGGMLNAVVVAGGRVAGTWKRVFRGKGVAITPALFRPLTPDEQRGFDETAERYARFVGASLNGM